MIEWKYYRIELLLLDGNFTELENIPIASIDNKNDALKTFNNYISDFDNCIYNVCLVLYEVNETTGDDLETISIESKEIKRRCL